MTQFTEGSIITVNGTNFRIQGAALVPTTDAATPTEFECGQVWRRDGEAYLLAEGGHTIRIDGRDAQVGAAGCVDWEDAETPEADDIFLGVGVAGITAALGLAQAGQAAQATATHAEAGNTFRYGLITYTVQADGSAVSPGGFTYDARTVAQYIGASTRVTAPAAQAATTQAAAHPQAGQRYQYGGVIYTIQPDGSGIDTVGRRVDARTVAAYLPSARRVDEVAAGQAAPRPGEQYEFGGARYLITDNGGAVRLDNGSVITPEVVRSAVEGGSARRVGAEGGQTYRVRYGGTVYTIQPDGSAVTDNGRRVRADIVQSYLPYATRL